MSYIFEQTASDKALILGPRESLVYPFAVGDWSEIRIGIAVSVVSTLGFNSGASTESLNVALNPLENYYFGIKTTGNNSSPLPYQSGNHFIGQNVSLNAPGYGGPMKQLRPRTTSDTNLYVIDITTNGTDAGFPTDSLIILYDTGINSISNGGLGAANADASFHMVGTSLYVSGASDYCTFNGLKIALNNRGQTNQNISVSTFNNRLKSAPSLTGLRNFLSSPTLNRTETGFFTEAMTATGNPIGIPNSLFVYNPFLNNQFRIHDILIEKYA